MDAKKTKIRELNEQIRESGERVRQIQKGAVIMIVSVEHVKIALGLTNGDPRQ